MSRDEQKRNHPYNDMDASGKTEGKRESDGLEESGEEFPGYPHYPASEDIMSSSSEMERVPLDVENVTPSGKYMNITTGSEDLSTAGATTSADATATGTDDDLRIVPGTEADVTRDDLLALGGSRTYSEDDLHGTSRSTTVTGDDLDVPGAELDNSNEEIGEEDEENNYYSLGGDRHENLEEDPTT